MTHIDRLLYAAKVLDTKTREYKPCLIVVKNEKGRWTVRGIDREFLTEQSAIQFCEDQAAGRRVAIVIDDIPRIVPDGDYIDTRTAADLEIAKELFDNGVEGTS